MIQLICALTFVMVTVIMVNYYYITKVQDFLMFALCSFSFLISQLFFLIISFQGLEDQKYVAFTKIGMMFSLSGWILMFLVSTRVRYQKINQISTFIFFVLV
jgi:hypothetical protein